MALPRSFFVRGAWQIVAVRRNSAGPGAGQAFATRAFATQPSATQAAATIATAIHANVIQATVTWSGWTSCIVWKSRCRSAAAASE
jgi:hypothetical protein